MRKKKIEKEKNNMDVVIDKEEDRFFFFRVFKDEREKWVFLIFFPYG